VPGTDRQVSFLQVAQKSYARAGVPVELGVGLDGVGAQEPTSTYPNGCFVCEVEVDIETGVIRADRLSCVDDVGRVVNPLTLEGQLHGSVAQGLEETLSEGIVYEAKTGQLLTGTFLDYAVARADMMPPHLVNSLAPAATESNLLGVKGGSEVGNVAMPAAVINAALDALGPLGVEELPLPATPERVWRCLQETAV